MRLVVHTNILVSALLAGTSLTALLIVLWRQGRFDLPTAAEQLDELRRVTRYPKIRDRLAQRSPGASSTTYARSRWSWTDCQPSMCQEIGTTTTCWRSPSQDLPTSC